MFLDGREVLAFTDVAATIAAPGGRTLAYYRAALSGSVPVWAVE